MPGLVLNGGKNLVAALNILMQASYHLGYFLKTWKKRKLKKPEESNYHVPSLYRSISLTNIFGKVFEKVTLQEAVTTLAENNFFEGINVYGYQKSKNVPHALHPRIEQMSQAV